MEKHGKGPQQMIADLMGWSIGQEQFYFKMFHNVVILVFPKKKKAIHKNLHYPQSLAEKTIQYLSGSWRSSYFLSFEANEKIAKEKARKSDETKYKHQAKCNL